MIEIILCFLVNTPLTDIPTELKYEIIARTLEPSIISIESSYNPNAVSPKGAIGLWQIMPETWDWFYPRVCGIKNDPFDKKANRKFGRAYFRYLLRKFDGDVRLSLAAYNAGETRLYRLKSQAGNFDSIYQHLPVETQTYINRIRKKNKLLWKILSRI